MKKILIFISLLIILTLPFFILRLKNENILKVHNSSNIKVEYVPLNNKEKKLLRRFSLYWLYRIQGELDKSFEYELPYQKYIDGIKSYKSKIESLNSRTLTILKDIIYPYPNVAIIERELRLGNRVFKKKDKWIYIDGEWYHKYYQNILPPMNKEEMLFQ